MDGCSMEVTFEDVSQVIRIVREVCDRWDNPSAWRGYLLKETCKLLSGNVGTMFDVTTPGVGKVGDIQTIAIFGLPLPEQKALVHTSTDTLSNRPLQNDSENMLPGQAKLWEIFRRDGWATAPMNELTDPDFYHASPIYQNLRKLADCDDYLWSVRFVDVPRRIEMFGLDRPHGAEPFGQREIVLLKLLHDEIAPLIGVRLTTEQHLSQDGLSRRLRETLALLLDGMSEKEVSVQLQLKPGTVHEYITSIYRHFNVSSRAELLAYFVRRAPKLRNSTEA
jgi:DNA-binding CsgD family transcriptional regulator